METLNLVKSEVRRFILRDFFPGMIALWPWILALIQFEFVNTNFLDKTFPKENYFYLAIIFTLIIYGFGHFIGKLGSRLEIWIEICKYGREDDPNPNEFYKVWSKYLTTFFEQSKTPVIIRYYSEFVTGYKFELSMIWALSIMIISLLFLELTYLDLFFWWGLILVCILSISTIFYLFYEAKAACSVANDLRVQINQQWDLYNPR